jgi:hypothetical protein
MALRYRVVLVATMTMALAFGFLHHLVPGHDRAFARLHIFLFNLVCGGALALYLAQRRSAPSREAKLYFVLGAGYALCGALDRHLLTLALSAPLLAVVEAVRSRRFASTPWELLRRRARIADRFTHASLLCLSLGIVVADLVILNQQRWHLVMSDKLTLDVFFLGYSFPVSLATMAVLFHYLGSGGTLASWQDRAEGTDGPAPGGRRRRSTPEMTFWGVNLGVMVFFLLIVLHWLLAEIAVATALFLMVSWLTVVFWRLAPPTPAKAWLGSGLGFLVCTGVTGVLYLLRDALALPGRFVLGQHAFVSLWGWNLVGLVAIARRGRPAIRATHPLLIGGHWLTVLVLAPLGKTSPWLAVAALPAALVVLGVTLLGRAQSALEIP